MTTPRKRIQDAINRLALVQPRECRKDAPKFLRRGDPQHCCCFCANAIHLYDQYRNAGSIRAHETCFKAVAEEYKTR